MNPTPIAAVLLVLAVGCGVSTPVLPAGRASEAPPLPPVGEGSVLVARLSGQVLVQAPNARGAVPIGSPRGRTVRVTPGTSILVPPGGHAALSFPDGSDLTVVDDATLEVLDPAGGALLRAASVRYLSAELRSRSGLELPGGAVAEGNGSRFVVRRVRERILRFEMRGGEPATIRLGDAAVALEAGRFVEVPFGGLPGGAGGAH